MGEEKKLEIELEPVDVPHLLNTGDFRYQKGLYAYERPVHEEWKKNRGANIAYHTIQVGFLNFN